MAMTSEMSELIQAVAGIVLVPFGVPAVAIMSSARRKLVRMRLDAEIAMARERAEAERGDGRLAVLEDRLRVLERIVTDRGYGLAGEIEALRREPSYERHQ
jgi:hypothetical protein